MVFVLVLLAGLYLGIIYARPDRLKDNRELYCSAHKAAIWRNLAVGVLLLFLVDGALFHTQFYARLLATESLAGSTAIQAAAERGRPPSGLQEIAVLGDSRIHQGFSAKVANELFQAQGYKFINLSLNGSFPRVWYYLLREIDPKCRRYRAIVMPVRFDNVSAGGDIVDATRDITLAAPLLRYTDALSFGSSFEQWPNKCSAFATCLLRGWAYRPDLLDLLRNPIARRQQIKSRAAFQEAEYNFKGEPGDIIGVTYDPISRKIDYPPNLTGQQRNVIGMNIQQVQHDPANAKLEWTRRILQRYQRSATTMMLIGMPRGPLPAALLPQPNAARTVRELITNSRSSIIEATRFASLESPAYYYDGYHFNIAGRQKFSEVLANEIVHQLHQPDSAVLAP